MAPNERRFKSRQCHVCKMPHGERFRLELERASGVSAEALSRKYRVSVVSIRKHWVNHVSDQVKAELIAGPVEMKELSARAAQEGMSLLDYIGYLRQRLLGLFATGAGAGDARQASLIAGRLIELLRFQAELGGQLQAYASKGLNVVNNIAVVNSPAFGELTSVILNALAKHPAARADVIGALRALDTDQLSNPSSTSDLDALKLIEATPIADAHADS